MAKVPIFNLSNGVKMPSVGLGTWQSNNDDLKNAVRTAIKAGYRLIDTATMYQNETQIGEVLEELFDEGVVRREDLFITTKAFCNEVAPDVVESALRASLERLKLDYVDLYLAHLPAATENDFSLRSDVRVEEIWRGFEHVYHLGLTKSIGVSNFSDSQLERILKIRMVAVHVSQVELHLYFPQIAHREICAKNNIVITSYASLGSPGRLDLEADGKKVFERSQDVKNEMQDENVQGLAQKYNKTPAQILLRELVENGIAVIPKSTNETRLAENINLFDFQLTQDDKNLLNSHKVPERRLFWFETVQSHPEYPF